MDITVEFWGPLERLAGARARTVTIGGAATVADVLALLDQELPGLGAALDRAAVAHGERLLQRRERVAPGMHLALLPPVAGG